MGSTIQELKAMLSPPGDTIQETIDAIGMSQTELAERMGRPKEKINDIIKGREPITTTTAFQLEKVLGIGAQFWLNREMLYREKLTRLEEEEILEQCQDWLKSQPIKELKQCGYLKTEKVSSNLVEECLKFYGVAAPSQWQSLYVNQYFPVHYRKSEAHKTTLGALAAWLRIGEIEMKKFDLVAYNKDTFKNTLIEVRNLVLHQPEDFALRLQQYCANAGVGLVYTICIPKAPISGAARWIGGSPLIQLTDRYKSNDHFWFTFFHEAGHILLHGKKDVFLEDIKEYDLDPVKEEEANEFAIKALLPGDIANEFNDKITERDIRMVARKYKTHAAIVLGYLQHNRKVTPYFGNELKYKINLSTVIKKQNE